MVGVLKDSHSDKVSRAFLVGMLVLVWSAGPEPAHAAAGTALPEGGAIPGAEAKSLLASSDVAKCSYLNSDGKTWVSKEWGMTLRNCIEASYRSVAASDAGCSAQSFSTSAKWGSRALRLSADMVEVSDSSNANAFHELVRQHVECQDYRPASEDGASEEPAAAPVAPAPQGASSRATANSANGASPLAARAGASGASSSAVAGGSMPRSKEQASVSAPQPMASAKQKVEERSAGGQAFCEAGDARACNSRGFDYWNGTGVKKDPAKAIELFRKACDAGNAEACVNLAAGYENGLGIKKDVARANELYRSACEAGEAGGCSNLAFNYGSGIGLSKELGKANSYYGKACEGRLAEACFNLAVNYQEGTGVQKSIASANDFFRKACELGYKEGCRQAAETSPAPYLNAPLPAGYQAVDLSQSQMSVLANAAANTIRADAQNWELNRLAPDSLGQVASYQDVGGQHAILLRLSFRYANGMGVENLRGWAEARFQNGKVFCIRYHDSGNCQEPRASRTEQLAALGNGKPHLGPIAISPASCFRDDVREVPLPPYAVYRTRTDVVGDSRNPITTTTFDHWEYPPPARHPVKVYQCGRKDYEIECAKVGLLASVLDRSKKGVLDEDGDASLRLVPGADYETDIVTHMETLNDRIASKVCVRTE
jgi:TPR repeat protein